MNLKGLLIEGAEELRQAHAMLLEQSYEIERLRGLIEKETIMKFRFYIVSVFDGNVRGTNDEGIARKFADSSGDYFAIDAAIGVWLVDEKNLPVPAYSPPKSRQGKSS